MYSVPPWVLTKATASARSSRAARSCATSGAIVPGQASRASRRPSTTVCAVPEQTRHSHAYDDEPKYIKVPDLTGFCLLVSREMLEIVGYQDERFEFYGAESEWLARARDKGLTCYMRRDVFVHHDHGATVKRDPQYNTAQRALGQQTYRKIRKERKG